MFFRLAVLVGCISLLSTPPATAQKIKKDPVPVAITQLPSHPLPPDYSTYSVNVYGYGLERTSYAATSAEKQFEMAGYKRVAQGGHFNISVYVSGFRVVENRNQSYKVTVGKDEDKREETRYKKILKYKMPVRYRVQNHEGEILMSGTAGTDPVTKEYGKGAKSSSALSKSFNSDAERLYRGYATDLAKTHISGIAGNVRARYAFQPKTFRTQLFVVGKKVDNAEGYTQAYETAKSAFELMKPDEVVDAVREAVQPAMEFWVAESNKYSPKEKKERKLYFANKYNLAKVHYYLDDLDKAEIFIAEGMRAEVNEAQLKSLQRDIESLRELLKKNELAHRHPSFDLSGARPPASASYAGMEGDDEADEAVAAGGAVTLQDGSSVEGDFRVSAADDAALSFGEKGTVQFVYLRDGRTTDMPLDPATVQGFSIGDRKFVSMDYTPGSKGNTTSEQALVEVLYESPKINVYKYYPYNDLLNEKKNEFAFKMADGPMTSTSGSTFLLFNSGLAKYFAACADLATAAKGGEFKHTQDDVIRAARVYAEACE